MRPFMIAAVLLCASSVAAHADIIGDTFEVYQTTLPGSQKSLGEITIPGTGHGSQGFTNFSITGTQVQFTFSGITPLLTSFTFQDLTGPTGITSIRLDPGSKSGFVFISPSFTTNSFSFLLAGVAGTSDRITFDLGYAASVTPELSSVALLGTGLVAMLGLARRRFV